MDKVLNIYKPCGMTPVQLIQKLREIHPEYKDVKIGFAGRLDPLAHGVMLLTVGEENKNRQKYLGLNKTYQFSVLFGVSTDSYDYLGLPESLEIGDVPVDLEKKIEQFIKQNKGEFFQPYPPFSSKTIDGMQMFKLAKKNKLEGKDIPVKEVEIFNFKLFATEVVSALRIRALVLGNLKKITGHFRQKETISRWKELLELNPGKNFTLVHFKIECSSGTYVRSLANKMGGEFNCGAIAFEIYRIKVGSFDIKDSLIITSD